MERFKLQVRVATGHLSYFAVFVPRLTWGVSQVPDLLSPPRGCFGGREQGGFPSRGAPQPHLGPWLPWPA